MTALMLHPQGRVLSLDAVTLGRAESLLADQGSIGPFVRLTMSTEDTDFEVWMGIDPTQPINVFARQAIDRLSSLHMVCFGPVLLTGLDESVALELRRG